VVHCDEISFLWHTAIMASKHMHCFHIWYWYIYCRCIEFKPNTKSFKQKHKSTFNQFTKHSCLSLLHVVVWKRNKRLNNPFLNTGWIYSIIISLLLKRVILDIGVLQCGCSCVDLTFNNSRFGCGCKIWYELEANQYHFLETNTDTISRLLSL